MFSKFHRQTASRLTVVVVTPLGEGGKGGIDRMMDSVRYEFREHPRANVDLRFVASRGANIYLSPVVLAWALLRIIFLQASQGIDVIHINLAANASAYRKFIVAAVASALRIPYIVHLHSGEFDHFWNSCNGFARRRIETLFSKAEFVIVLGQVWSDLVVTNLPELADRIIIMPNSTRKQRHNFHSDGPVKILFLGRLSPAKGIGELLDSFEIIRHRNDWQATLAGDGAVTETRILVERLGLAERVRIPGWLDDGGVTAELQVADILVLPSWVENLPMCVVEAFAHGLAVVCTPVGALPEIVEHERTGLLVPVKNAPALAQALERLLTDPALRARLGIQARAQHAIQFEIGAYVDKLVGVWQGASRAERRRADPSSSMTAGAR
ncbi:glycosyltransferase family 4 protein [Bradyrhizobium sp. AUGA SZCCT0158]|uniref:glycosyltransferase family 4 protein n=1 Tax=Bradyrhizobium sp. AUGA SZCCT0158 TaxID=2807661 RepID=UPI001BAD4899|nr:glycosyltransferase family 4 protein [Bradyrhizobium sp. AUGA SZCCT0158]MBR1197424.1 glycosyltransferase family 4 protein [Bradyrhizobium sp. AUGA SZCCT0158]